MNNIQFRSEYIDQFNKDKEVYKKTKKDLEEVKRIYNLDKEPIKEKGNIIDIYA